MRPSQGFTGAAAAQRLPEYAVRSACGDDAGTRRQSPAGSENCADPAAVGVGPRLKTIWKDLLRLRLAAVQLLDQKQYAEALKTLENKADETPGAVCRSERRHPVCGGQDCRGGPSPMK